jgi:Lsr2
MTSTAVRQTAPSSSPSPGTEYEIDLNSKHAEQFRKAVSPFIEAARKSGGTWSRRAASRAARSSGPSPSEVRDWAKAQGIAVKDRGRVPGELVVKFQAAQ